MNGQQKAVLWIGLILVGLNLVRHWGEIVSVIFTGSGLTGGIPSGGSGGSSGGFNIPGLPTIPGVGGHLPITLMSTSKAQKTVV